MIQSRPCSPSLIASPHGWEVCKQSHSGHVAWLLHQSFYSLEKGILWQENVLFIGPPMPLYSSDQHRPISVFEVRKKNLVDQILWLESTDLFCKDSEWRMEVFPDRAEGGTPGSFVLGVDLIVTTGPSLHLPGKPVTTVDPLNLSSSLTLLNT